MNENEIIEEWKPIEGYEGLYEVSNLGRVKSLKANNGKPRQKIMKQYEHRSGYLQVKLYKEGEMIHCNVHRLVAHAFLGRPNLYTCLKHKDGNVQNNCVDNLEWYTTPHNLNYGTCQQRKVSK